MAKDTKQGDKEIYDGIVEEYSSIKTNPYKHFVEEPTFWSILGDLSNKTVLDLACGSGHFSRQMRTRGARIVVGVDISSEMIAEARRLGDPSTASTGGLVYAVGDASKQENYASLLKEASGTENLFEIVTAQYLFPYADSEDTLMKMCKTAFEALAPGGSFCCITCCATDGFKPYSKQIGYRIRWPGDEEGGALPDGTCVQMTIFGAGEDVDSPAAVTFPNFMWRRESIQRALERAGFVQVQWAEEEVSEEGREWAEGARQDFGLCGFIVCRKPK